MNIFKYLIFLTFFIIPIAISSITTETIGEGLNGQELWDYIIENYKTTTTLGYDDARDTMYSVIDLKDGNQLTGIYSGYTITLNLENDPSTDAYNQGINCEHTWPQSMGAEDEPQRSDLHHLFPAKSNVNSSRGNYPYNEIPDENADRWYRNDETLYNIPSSNIDEYSEKENDGEDCFEVREDHKGNSARAAIYFFAMYNSAADTVFWNKQKDVLLQWHYLDPVDDYEYDRTWAIAYYQDDCPNPFVIDSTLARRIWFSSNQPENPSNIEIVISNDTVIISWDPVDSINSYQIKSSITPYDNESYIDVSENGIFYESNGRILWESDLISSKNFFKVFSID